MKKRRLVVLALLCASTAAYAQGGPSYSGGPSPLDSQYLAQARLYDAPSPERYGRALGNANDCAPDRPEPVWGAGNALLGYSCVRPIAK
jgi:hypothetical protein